MSFGSMAGFGRGGAAFNITFCRGGRRGSAVPTVPPSPPKGGGVQSGSHNSSWTLYSLADVGTAPLCRPQAGLHSTLPFVEADGAGAPSLHR